MKTTVLIFGIVSACCFILACGGNSAKSADALGASNTQKPGRLWVWGTVGKTAYPKPTRVEGIDNVVSIATPHDFNGYSIYFAATTADGKAWLWGSGGPRNMVGELSATPAEFKTVPGKAALAPMAYRFVALDAGGRVFWYDSAIGGSFVQLKIDGKVTAIAGGWENALALTESGDVWTWGLVEKETVGRSKIEGPGVAMKIPNISNAVMIDAYDWKNIVVTSDGSVWTWGENSNLDNLRLPPHVPRKIAGLSNVTHAAAGSSQFIALTSSGEVWTWGSSQGGALGRGKDVIYKGNTYVPGKVDALKDVIFVEAGSHTCYAITKDGELFGWGPNWGGVLGLGDKQERWDPVKVDLPGRALRVATSGTHTLAVTE